MQKKNCTLAFDHPPLTRDQIGAKIDAESKAKQLLFEQNPEWKTAATSYSLSEPCEGIIGQTVELKRKNTEIPYTVDWGWEQSRGKWQPTISIESVTKVIDEINKTPFIQDLNKRIPLDFALYAEHGHFYRTDFTSDMAPKACEDAKRAKALIRAAGCAQTDDLVQIIARSKEGPLLLWRPRESHFWLISWNLKIFPEWAKAYKDQTGMDISDMDSSSGWIATCNDEGVLKMVRKPQQKP
jgi:hypothetical protein